MTDDEAYIDWDAVERASELGLDIVHPIRWIKKILRKKKNEVKNDVFNSAVDY